MATAAAGRDDEAVRQQAGDRRRLGAELGRRRRAGEPRWAGGDRRRRRAGASVASSSTTDQSRAPPSGRVKNPIIATLRHRPHAAGHGVIMARRSRATHLRGLARRAVGRRGDLRSRALVEAALDRLAQRPLQPELGAGRGLDEQAQGHARPATPTRRRGSPGPRARRRRSPPTRRTDVATSWTTRRVAVEVGVVGDDDVEHGDRPQLGAVADAPDLAVRDVPHRAVLAAQHGRAQRDPLDRARSPRRGRRRRRCRTGPRSA